MPTMKLTSRAIREQLPAPDPSGRQTIYWAEGDKTPGLGILVSGVSASKSWVCQGNVNGKSRRLTIGPVAVLTIEQAWDEAKPKLAAMLGGRDPKLTVPQRKLAAMTVAEIFEDYLAANSNLKQSTIDMYRSSVRHLGPLLKRTMRDIDADQVERLFRGITAEVVARRERGEIRGGINVRGHAIANCALRLFGSLWEFQAERDNGLGPNPVRGRRFKKQWHNLDRRTRHVPADRLAEFYQATRRLPSDIQRDLVLFGLFTGMREGEAAALKWDEVDLQNRMLRLPARRMKAKKQFDLPMSDVVHQILLARRIIGREGPFVFPGHGKSGHCESFTYALGQIEEATGIKTSPHDIRRTFASIAATCPIPPVALKMLLAHSTGSDVTAGYTILSHADFRAAVQQVADRMKQLCGIEELAGENVTKFGAA